jgi:hypothetical protein
MEKDLPAGRILQEGDHGRLDVNIAEKRRALRARLSEPGTRRLPVAEDCSQHGEIIRPGRAAIVSLTQVAEGRAPVLEAPFTDGTTRVEQQNRRNLPHELSSAPQLDTCGRQLLPRHSRQGQIDVGLCKSWIGLKHVVVLRDRLVEASCEVEDAPYPALDNERQGIELERSLSFPRARHRTDSETRETSHTTAATEHGRG